MNSLVVTFPGLMARTKRSLGALESIDDRWKLRVRAKIEKDGRTRADLASRVGAKSASTITMLLKTEDECAESGAPCVRQTRLKGKIERDLDLHDEGEKRLAGLISEWNQLDEVGQDALLQLIRTMKR